jgi:hypothetical protein
MFSRDVVWSSYLLLTICGRTPLLIPELDYWSSNRSCHWVVHDGDLLTIPLEMCCGDLITPSRKMSIIISRMDLPLPLPLLILLSEGCGGGDGAADLGDLARNSQNMVRQRCGSGSTSLAAISCHCQFFFKRISRRRYITVEFLLLLVFIFFFF